MVFPRSLVFKKIRKNAYLRLSENLQYSGGFVETALLILAGIFVVGMLILLPKYAKFIHNQPKIEADNIRRREEERNSSERD